jgi:hypothetical protein
MRQDQYERLQALEEKLADVFIGEAEPEKWPGHGLDPGVMDQKTRGDRYWVKKNAVATLSLMQRVAVTLGQVQLRGGTTPPKRRPLVASSRITWTTRCKATRRKPRRCCARCRKGRRKPRSTRRCMDARPVSFLAFFLMWAKLQGWKVPQLHVRVCHWLETCTDPERVLMVFRGAAKSTIYAVYKAWRLYRNRSHRSLVWSADNDTAGMLTADTINVLRNHPLTLGMLPNKPGAKRFWVTGARDARNASMRAVGVTSNATGARADDVDFDDIEVPGNIETPEARLKLRQRISESTHIAVPGAQKTYIGTPHTHDSIYPERIAGGATVLKIPLFAHSVRYTETRQRTAYEFRHPVGEDGLYVMAGILKGSRMLRYGVDYRFEAGLVIFPKPPGVTIDICSCCAWPERFTRVEIERRRKETMTLNAWDSQYQLEAKPLGEVRLDPERIKAYDVEPSCGAPTARPACGSGMHASWARRAAGTHPPARRSRTSRRWRSCCRTNRAGATGTARCACRGRSRNSTRPARRSSAARCCRSWRR